MKIRTNELVLCRDFNDDVFKRLVHVANGHQSEGFDKEKAIDVIYDCINRIVTLARIHGFEGNLWNGYLTYLLTTNENAFSMASEKRGAVSGTLNQLALHDLKIFKVAYEIDWETVEKQMGVHFFGLICRYEAGKNKGIIYSHGLGERINDLSVRLRAAEDEHQMYQVLTGFYKDYGVGKFGLHRAFKILDTDGHASIMPITKTEKVYLNDLVGYEIQKKKLIDNTKAFICGQRANNVLLYGDSGTGKSTSIKAILNEYYKDGLRLIEVYKHQFKNISDVIAQVKNRNYKFILYMDDLSFEEFEIEYKYLKAIIEGGLETKPGNVLIYATSNRRHIIRETWDDRRQKADDVHGGDTMQEKHSLVTRFGETIYYGAPDQKEYIHIVKELSKRYGLDAKEEELAKEAIKWEMSHGGLSGRTAQQFMNHLAGIKALYK